MSGRGLLLTIAIIVAAIVFYTMQGQIEQAPQVAQKDVSVMISRSDLAVGAFIQGPQDLDWVLMDKAAREERKGTDVVIEDEDGGSHVNMDMYFVEGNVRLEDFKGAVVRRPLKAGQPVPQDALMKSGEGGFLSAVLEPGMRAVSIAVNATTGNAGFVSPGDRVDLIVTHRFRHSNSNDETVVSKTFVDDVRVVAVDQMLDNPENKAILAKTITVECSPVQAEQIAVATEMGKISLALRSISPSRPEPVEATAAVQEGSQPVELKNASEEVEHTQNQPQESAHDYTRDSDLSHILRRKSLDVPRVQVIRGDETQTIDFTLSSQ